MDTGIKQRKAIVRRKHVRPMESARPEEVRMLYRRSSFAFLQEL